MYITAIRLQSQHQTAWWDWCTSLQYASHQSIKQLGGTGVHHCNTYPIRASNSLVGLVYITVIRIPSEHQTAWWDWCTSLQYVSHQSIKQLGVHHYDKYPITTFKLSNSVGLKYIIVTQLITAATWWDSCITVANFEEPFCK